jgi:hypothetical protein
LILDLIMAVDQMAVIQSEMNRAKVTLLQASDYWEV